MNLSLRPFQKNDLQHLDRWSSAVGAGRFMQKVTPLGYQGPDDLSRWGGDYVWYAIELDEQAIGGVWVDRRRPGDSIGILGVIIGRPEYLGRGIGRRVIPMAMELASGILGLTTIRLTVRQANERAVRSYRSVGFQVTGRGTVLLPDGTPAPFYRMETRISPDRRAV